MKLFLLCHLVQILAVGQTRTIDFVADNNHSNYAPKLAQALKQNWGCRRNYRRNFPNVRAS